MKTKEFYNTPEKNHFEYLLIANPGGEIRERLKAEKQIFYDDYKQKADIETSPHIVIASFFAKEQMEDTVLRWMQRICSKQQSFTVTLNNYSGFPPDKIYLRIQNETPFRRLAKELSVINAYVNSCSCPPMIFTHKPHVSIADRLSEQIFCRALTHYAHKSFHETFLVNELLLLKRKDEHDAGKIVIVFALQPAEIELVN